MQKLKPVLYFSYFPTRLKSNKYAFTYIWRDRL
nr:MAG TPA_asm: hypothetical protein [Caudoviricetes sp.]